MSGNDGWERHGQVTKKTRRKKGEPFVVDTREPESMHIQFETFHEPFRIRTLRAGDYKKGYSLAERKTIFDFVASFRNTRIFNQLEELTREECFPFLLVTGTMDKLKSDVHFKNVNEKTVIGAMASCMCRYAVNVIWTPDDTQAVMIIIQLFRELEKYTPKEYDNSFLLLTGTVSELSKMGERRKEVISTVAEIIGKEGVNVMWSYDNTVGLRVMSRMFHKINEGKRGQPRRRMIKHDTGSRTADLVRSFLRVEPALAVSLTQAARKKKMGVMRYILETPNHNLLSHPGMGNVTLKRIRELVG